MWLGICRSYTFIQSFQVGGVRHAQSDSKQRVSYIRKVNLGIELIFWMWLGIHKCIYLIQSSGCGQTNLGMPKVITIIKSTICLRLTWTMILFLAFGLASRETTNCPAEYHEYSVLYQVSLRKAPLE